MIVEPITHYMRVAVRRRTQQCICLQGKRPRYLTYCTSLTRGHFQSALGSTTIKPSKIIMYEILHKWNNMQKPLKLDKLVHLKQFKPILPDSEQRACVFFQLLFISLA